MIINTTAEGISLAKKLETESGSFYEALAKMFPQGAEMFLAFTKENKKNITNIETTYYSVITDAIEGCFAFNIDSDDFVLNTKINDKDSYSEAIKKAVQIEEQIIKYYSLAAEQSRSLMADVPRVFLLVAKKRSDRKSKLESLLA